MKWPLFIFTIYLFVFMHMAVAIGPMIEDIDTTVTTAAQTGSV